MDILKNIKIYGQGVFDNVLNRTLPERERKRPATDFGLDLTYDDKGDTPIPSHLLKKRIKISVPLRTPSTSSPSRPLVPFAIFPEQPSFRVYERDYKNTSKHQLAPDENRLGSTFNIPQKKHCSESFFYPNQTRDKSHSNVQRQHMKEKSNEHFFRRGITSLKRRLIATKADTIRIQERCEYIELLNLEASKAGLRSIYSNTRYQNNVALLKTSNTNHEAQDLTAQKLALPELLRLEGTGTFSHDTRISQYSPSRATSTPKNVAGSSRSTLTSSFNTSLSPFVLSKTQKNVLGHVETIDLTIDDEKPSTSQMVPWSPKYAMPSSAWKIDYLGHRIKAVMDNIFGPVIDLRGDDIQGDVSGSQPKQSDNDIQILSETLTNRSPVNTLALDFGNIAITKGSWLNEHKSSYVEKRRENAEKIDREEKTLAILRNESKLRDDLNGVIRRNLTLTDIIELDKEEEKLPEITEEMEQIINQAKGGYNQNEILMTTPANISITRGDIKSLAPTKWLNDNVINSYLDMIALRSKNSNYPSVYAFTTFFYPKYVNEGYSNILKRWTRKVDIFSYDLLIFPIHLGVHWCLASADLRHKTMKYYDSLGGNNYNCPKALLQYLCKEHLERKKSSLKDLEWTMEVVKGIPQQENGSDCGMFSCKFAEYLSRDSELTFKQEHMNYYRERMIYEIIKQDLLFP